MAQPVEISVYEFLADLRERSVYEDVLFGIEIHDTPYQSIQTSRGLRVSEASSTLLPGPGGELKEFNASLTIVCYSKVEGKDKKARQPALVDVFAIQQAVVQALVDSQDLGGRVCDTRIEEGVRGYDSMDGAAYAVVHIPLVINPSS